MNSLLYAALGTGFTFLMTALGAGVVFCFRRPPSGRMKRIYLGFAAGVMAAATIWSLLLPAIGRAEEMGLPGWLPAAGGIVLGAAFLMLIEAGIARLSARRRMRLGSRALLLTAITLHNIPEGMAVGLSFALAVQSGSPALMAGAVSLALGIGVQNLKARRWRCRCWTRDCPNGQPLPSGRFPPWWSRCSACWRRLP